MPQELLFGIIGNCWYYTFNVVHSSTRSRWVPAPYGLP